MAQKDKLFFYKDGDAVFHFSKTCPEFRVKGSIKSGSVGQIDHFQVEYEEKYGFFLEMCDKCRREAAGIKPRYEMSDEELMGILAVDDDDEFSKLVDTSGLEEANEDDDTPA